MKISRWSKLWNWWYWLGKSGIDSRETMEAVLNDPFGNGDDTCFDDIVEWIKSFEYRGDGFRIHWTQYPITTVHREKGDCEDFAWLWYNQLTRLGYKPEIWKLYRRTWYTLGILVWWHTVAYVNMNGQCWTFSNTRAKQMTVVKYCVEYGYYDMRRVDK